MSGECERCNEHPVDCLCDKVCDNHITCYKPEWGFHNLMVLAAFRYCLGRRTYIVSSCVDWLIKYWDAIDQNTKNIILKETQEAIEKEWAGDKCDERNWKQLMKHAIQKK